ncbi:hypothetical protein F66182_6761 [Fusarium sp. NRRL 66182]|nr:hypothetical protein F66182_6761 [Fusarium sp. NRRL 66182]
MLQPSPSCLIAENYDEATAKLPLDCQMEVYDQSEVFVEKDGDLEFSYTKAIFKQGNKFFYSISERRLPPASVIEVPPSGLHEIPLHHIWPQVDINLTEAPDPLPPDCYVKEPRLIEYGDNKASLNPGSQLLHEATIWEALKDSPHPNIARFLGCIIKEKRLAGLCFVKYSMNLFEVVRSSKAVDIEGCLLGIENGIQHLHGLGYVHNDLNPSNIMMEGDVPIIIDMDSCQLEGAKIGVKGGTVGWASCESGYAERKNDIDALSKIRSYLEEVCNRN